MSKNKNTKQIKLRFLTGIDIETKSSNLILLLEETNISRSKSKTNLILEILKSERFVFLFDIFFILKTKPNTRFFGVQKKLIIRKKILNFNIPSKEKQYILIEPNHPTFLLTWIDHWKMGREEAYRGRGSRGWGQLKLGIV